MAIDHETDCIIFLCHYASSCVYYFFKLSHYSIADREITSGIINVYNLVRNPLDNFDENYQEVDFE